MPTITIQSSFDTIFNSVLSTKEFKNRYLNGVAIPDSITEETFRFFIDSAISELEMYLGLKINKQVITESKDFRNTDWTHWGYLPCTYPVVYPLELVGFLGTTKQVTYPKDWLSSKSTNDNKNYSRRISLVPARNSAQSEAIIYSGIMPQAHYFQSTSIPDYWEATYITGWDEPPTDILDAIGMIAAIKILQIISDALMSGTVKQSVDANGKSVLQGNSTQFAGLGFGMSSKSISIDGLSQSYSSYINGQTGVWGARMKLYIDTMDPKKPGSHLNRLYDQYGAVVMNVS